MRRLLSALLASSLVLVGHSVASATPAPTDPNAATVSAQATSDPGSQVLITASLPCYGTLSSTTSVTATVSLSGYYVDYSSNSTSQMNLTMTLTGAVGAQALTGTALPVLGGMRHFTGSVPNGVTLYVSGNSAPCQTAVVGTVTVAASPLLPWGQQVGDLSVAVGDDNAQQVAPTDPATGRPWLTFAPTVYGPTYQSLYISTNGLVSFMKPLPSYVGTTVPGMQGSGQGPVIAALFADADTRYRYSNCVPSTAEHPFGDYGGVWWRATTFNGQHAVVITWAAVAPQGGACANSDTFQLVLVAAPDEGPNAFRAVFNYGGLAWTHGSASPTGYPWAGLDYGDGMHATVLTSGTSAGYPAAQTLSFGASPGQPTGRYVVDVTPKPHVTWPTPAAITYGTSLSSVQLNATADAPGSFYYYPNFGSILNVGQQTLTATFYPADQYHVGSTATTTITVNQATPTISWSPTAITYGTALGAAQLNATASVPGTFAYTVHATGAPASGVVLHAGANQLLDVTFTPTSANYKQVSSSAALTVNQAPQPISIDPVSAHTYGDAPFSVHATGGASGNPISFTVGANDGCALSGTTTVTYGSSSDAYDTVQLTHAGTCTLTASQAGTSDYLAGTNSRSVSVAQATPHLSWQPGALTYGAPLGAAQLNASSGGVAGSFAYTVDGGPVDPNTVLAAGPHTLGTTFTPTDTTDYTTASTTVTDFRIAQASQTIGFAALADHVYGDAPATFPVSGGASGKPVTFATTGPCAVTPSNAGALLSFTGAGQCSVTASQDGTDNYTAATPVTRTFSIAKGTPSLSWTAPDDITYGAPLGTAQLSAASPVPGSFAYTADSTATDASGRVLGAGGHTLHVQFTPTDSTDWTGASRDVALTVARATPAVSWDPAGLTYGTALGAAQLDATSAVPGTFAYTPDDGSVLDAGEHDLSAVFTPDDGADYTSVTVTAPVHVDRAAQPLAFADIADHTFGDAPFPVTATGGASGRPVTIAATGACRSGTSSAGIDTSGNATGTATVTLTGAGACLLTAHQDGDANHLPAVDAVHSVNSAPGTPTLSWADPDPITYGTALDLTQLDATSSVPGSFAYAVVGSGASATGAVLHAGDHQLQVLFTPGDGTDYTTATATVTVHVDQAPQLIDLATPATHTLGDGPVSISVSGGGSAEPVMLSVQPGGACQLDSASTVALTGSGVCAVTASQDGTDDYLSAASVTVAFFVQPGTDPVRLDPIAQHTYGDAPIVPGVHAGSSSAPVTLTASPASVCMMSDPTHVTLVGFGFCTVAARQDADHDWTASRTVTRFWVHRTAVRVVVLPSNRFYGSPDPAPVVRYVGLLPGDSTGDLTGALTVSTIAQDSPVGNYSLSVGGLSSTKYVLDFLGGRLTVTKAPLRVGVANLVTNHGTAPAFTPSVSGLVAGDTADVLFGTPTYTVTSQSGAPVTADGSTPAGRYQVRASGLHAANYTISYPAGTWKVR